VRPLAVVMVSDPTSITLTNLRRLAGWCDLLLTEGTTTFAGAPRTAVRDGWREHLGLSAPELRIVTTDLGDSSPIRRQLVQRSSAMPVLAAEPDDRWVLLVDADEFIDPDALLTLIDERAEAPEPVRIGLVPRYGAVDRCALRIHCCWHPDAPDLRASSGPWTMMPGGLLARAGSMRGRLPHHLRYSSPIVDWSRTFGTHVTMCEPGERTARKLANMRHRWDPRVMDARHLDTMLGAGVHHAGWWICVYDEPEPWLMELARSTGLRIAGPPAPDAHLRALRAWAEARLDPLVPDSLVRAGDEYVAARPHDAVDFLAALDRWLLSRPIEHTGHITHAGPTAHE
jgi:hypothetical protein